MKNVIEMTRSVSIPIIDAASRSKAVGSHRLAELGPVDEQTSTTISAIAVPTTRICDDVDGVARRR